MSKAPVSTAFPRQINFAVPAWIAPIVRNALEARAKEFEDSVRASLSGDGPSGDTVNAWLGNAKELRRLASMLPRTENGRASK